MTAPHISADAARVARWHRPTPDQPGSLAEIAAALWQYAHDDDPDRERASTNAHLGGADNAWGRTLSDIMDVRG